MKAEGKWRNPLLLLLTVAVSARTAVYQNPSTRFGSVPVRVCVSVIPELVYRVCVFIPFISVCVCVCVSVRGLGVCHLFMFMNKMIKLIQIVSFCLVCVVRSVCVYI